MSLTVLSDSNVKDLLHNLTRYELEDLLDALRKALHEYSTGKSNEGACANAQPKRTVAEWRSGATTLFMPSTSSAGIGLKVVTLPKPSTKHEEPTEAEPIPKASYTTPVGAMTIMSNSGRPTGFLNAEEVTAFRTALASSLLVVRRTRVKNLVVFGSGRQAYWHVRLALKLRGSTIKRVSFVNRAFNSRAKDTMAAFTTTNHIDAEMKELEGWTDCSFNLLTPAYREYTRIMKDQLRKADVIFCTTPSLEPLFDHTILTNTDGRRKGRLIVAIGSYKPHMIEVPPELLIQATKLHGAHAHYHKHAEEGGVIVIDTLACTKESGEFVRAKIEPAKSVELGELVMLDIMDDCAVDESSTLDDSPRESLDSSSLSSQDVNSTPTSSSPSLSRSLASVFSDSSTQVNSSSHSLSQKSSLSNLPHRSTFGLPLKHGSTTSLDGKPKRKQNEHEDQRSRWLSKGNVIYKSVGLGLMDLVVGGELVKHAEKKGVGFRVENF